MSGEDWDATDERLVEEVRALRAANAVLRERNACLEAVVEVINDAVFVKDRLGRYRMINSAGAALLDRSVEDVLGKHDAELFPPNAARQISEVNREILTRVATRTFEESVTLSEDVRSFLVTKGPYLDEQGRAIGVIGISRDITERKRAVEALRKAQEFLTLLLENSPAAVYVVSNDGRVRLVNRAWEELSGKRREEVVGRPVGEVFPPQEARRFLDQNQMVIETAAPIDIEEKIGTSDGLHVFHTVKFPLRNAANQIEAVGGITFDVTDRKRAEESLEESRRRLQAIFDNTLDAIWLLDDEGRFVDANPAICTLLGYSREEFLRMTVEGVTPLEFRGKTWELWRTILAQGHYGGEFAQVHKDGTNRDVDIRVVANILPGLHLSVNRDISERKRAEVELRKTEEQVRLLLDSTAEAIYGLDLEGRCTFCNASCLRLLGYTDPGDLLGKDMHDKIHHTRPDGTAYSWEECRIFRGFRQGEGTHVEDEILWRADGTSFPAEYWSYPIRRGNEVVGAVVTFLDISERRRVEEELRTLNAALENAVEGIARYDAQGHYLTVNRAYADMLGYRPEDLIGKHWTTTLHPRDREKSLAAHQRMLDEGRSEVEVLGVRADGSTFWKQNVKVRVQNQQGQFLGHYCFTKDITERKRAQKALRNYAERSQVLSRRVVEVQEEERRHLARELHDEIGQTLTAIGINLQAVKRSAGKEALPYIEECNGIVDHAIQQVRHLSLDLRPPMLDDLGLVAALRWYLDRQAQRVGYQARFVADPEEVHLDPAVGIAVFRVAQEALTNIARHANARRVRVTLDLSDNVLRLVVRDDGTGFEPGANIRRGTREAGLGLLGMRERATLLGGRVNIRSTLGRGTEVRLTVPQQRA